MTKNRTLQENGRLRGKEILEKYGPEHFAEMGRKSAKAQQEKYGTETYRERGRKGAAALLKKHKKHMEKMRAKRWGKPFPKEVNALDYLLGKK